MRIFYPDGCEQTWRESLSQWQLDTLAAIHRQGKDLRDGTNHGSDHRWQQAGVHYYASQYRQLQRNPRTRGHEAIIIRKESYGFSVHGVRRATMYNIDLETGEALPAVIGWQTAWIWYVGADRSANFPLDGDRMLAAA